MNSSGVEDIGDGGVTSSRRSSDSSSNKNLKNFTFEGPAPIERVGLFTHLKFENRLKSFRGSKSRNKVSAWG